MRREKCDFFFQTNSQENIKEGRSCCYNIIDCSLANMRSTSWLWLSWSIRISSRCLWTHRPLQLIHWTKTEISSDSLFIIIMLITFWTCTKWFHSLWGIKSNRYITKEKDWDVFCKKIILIINLLCLLKVLTASTENNMCCEQLCCSYISIWLPPSLMR